MHAIGFIQDLAIIMLIAGFISILFHKLNQPVVLGYIIAGIIMGPNTPPFSYISNQETIQTLAQLGIVFLMFSLGLEFSFQNLKQVGAKASVIALGEIIIMILLGYSFGKLFQWNTIDAIFLGGILAISSTTIVVKAIKEMHLGKESFVQLIYGILIIEDLLGVAILAILPSLALDGSVPVSHIILTMVKLISFLIITFLAGLYIIPKLLSYVATFHSRESMLVIMLSLCFGFCLLVLKMGYSVALGAFLIGAIMAESNEIKTIKQLTAPVRDMFSAIFFVSVGLLLDPMVVINYAYPIMVITVVVIVGKVLSCSIGAILVGKDGKSALHVGMSLAQIGEFSFIIAALGLSLNVTSHIIYLIAVAVSVITTFLTPYLIRVANPLAKYLTTKMPHRFVVYYQRYRMRFEEEE